MHAILNDLDREHLYESLPYIGVAFGMAVVAAVFMMVAVLGLVTTL